MLTFKKIKKKFKKCKFSNKCKLFSKNSYTCNNRGGRYCGKWREKELKETLN